MVRKNRIKIESIENAKRFVEKAMSVDGDVILQKGKFAVDGKSLLGVLSIDLRDGITVIYPADAAAFEQFILTIVC